MDDLFARPFDSQSFGVTKFAREPFAQTTRRLHRFQDGLVRGRMRQPIGDRLFFAILPDPETATRIADLRQQLRAEHGLTGTPVKAEHFHVTLFHVCDSVGFPPGLVEAMTERAASVAMPPFRIEFDRAMSFSGGAFVLSGDDSLIGVQILQQRLGDAVDGRPQRARSFTPHLTLLRDNQRVSERPIEPIGWTAREVVLVHSLLGRTTHRHLARFPLR